MNILISGGCKNGKTSIAEKIIVNSKNSFDNYYIATMIPYDAEDYKRIDNHRKEREKYNFKTIEVQNNLDELKIIEGNFLFDSLTAYLLNHIVDNTKNVVIKENNNNLLDNSINDVENKIEDIYKKIIDDIDNNLFCNNHNTVFISDYIYSDSIQYDNFTKIYVQTLAKIEKYIAKKVDILCEVSYGNIICYKGNEEFERLY